MEIGRVSELWRYPFKSMGGERTRSGAISAGGVAGDRRWAIRDEVDGGIRGAKKFAALLGCHARLLAEPGDPNDDGHVEITLRSGDRILSSDQSVAATLSRLLDHKVTIWPLQPIDNLDHHRPGKPTFTDVQQELRTIYALEPDEPLPNVRRLPRELLKSLNEFVTPPGTYFDAFPLLVLTSSALRTLQELNPESSIDRRRFRPNILLETDLAGNIEAEWEGRLLRIGEVQLQLTWRCPRCVRVTHAFDDLPRDRSIMRTLVREFTHDFGIYATVLTPGDLQEGDTAILDSATA